MGHHRWVIYPMFSVVVLVIVAGVNLWLSDDAGRSSLSRQVHKIVAAACAGAAIAVFGWMFLAPLFGLVPPPV